MEIIGVLLLLICGFTAFVLLIVVLSKLKQANMSKQETKITQARLVGFERHHNTNDPIELATYTPILEYYNEFTGKVFKNQVFNTGILHEKTVGAKKNIDKVGHVGDLIQVEYSRKGVRVIDSRFRKPGDYSLKPWLYLLGTFSILSIVGFILIIIGVLFC